MEKKKNLIVMKFGGSCLQDAKSFEQIVKIIGKYRANFKLIIVVSAVKDITDKLVNFYTNSCDEGSECKVIIDNIQDIHRNLIKQLIDSKTHEYRKSIEYLNENIIELAQLGQVIRLIRPSMDIQDLILSYGEKLSTFILTQYLNSLDLKSIFISSSDIIITNDNFGNAMPLLNDTELLVYEKLNPLLKSEPNLMICVTGFYGSTKKDNKITTFGRGGSDLTAAILAYSMRNKYNCRVIYW
ncbi:MAG: hypothetical protein ACFE8C_02000, partial [Promethearchaeota archaeon]